MPHIIETTKDEALNPASLACIELLMKVLEDAKAGNVTSVAIVACGPSDFGANMAGPNAPAMNMGLDVLKAKIIANVVQPTPQSPILALPSGAELSDYQYSLLELRLRAECERGFIVGGLYDPKTDGKPAYAPTGDRYRELYNPDNKYAASEKEVYQIALETFRKHVEGKSGTIYWRTWPEIANHGKGWKFYMRLVVSDGMIGGPSSG